MEIHPDFDAGEVARSVALAVTNLHNRSVSSDSGNDDTPLIRKRTDMSGNSEFDTGDKSGLVSSKKSWKRYLSSIPARYVLTILGFLGFCNVYALRVNLSVALVAMVNQTNNKSAPEECSGPSHSNTSDTLKNGEFDWDANVQSDILGAFFYGYIFTQVPGGRMAEIFGGKWLFGLGVLCTSILTLLTPLAARWSVTALIVLRVLEGFGEGVTFPAMHSMLGSWLPKYERSMLSTIIYSGAQIGTVISLPISGLLCYSDFLGGWPSVFYVFGTLGCIWFIFWVIFIYETPEKHPRISQAELILIQTGKVENKEVPPIPWKKRADRNGRRLRTSITETARLVCCSRSAIVSIHAKWINDGDTSSRCQGVGRPHVIKEKGHRRLSRWVKHNWRQTVVQLTAQYNAGPNASVSEHTVQQMLLDMGLCSRRPTCVPLLTKLHRQLRLQWAREHRDWTMDEWKKFVWSDES
ncbi:Sialin [Araneus ventricosus]|uniref:Sialin n=1 Tax=Araneus ventricosus TaxID=182803 RepID=A0A4Y2CIE6_ARAVE|nr:Sialin [Araneus ventricosus]